MRGTTLALIVASTGLSGTTLAQDALITFGFTDLNGSFVSQGGGTGLFTAFSDPAQSLGSAGDVTRTGDTADFDAGTIGTPAAGLFQLDLAVTNITLTGALATGTFVIQDATGDTLSGTLSGTWFFGPGPFAFFNAEITSAIFTAEEDSAFDGTSGGSFTFADLDSVLNGGFSVLFLRNGGFRSNFEGVSVQADGILVPAPTSLALLGLAGLAAGRRRR